MAIAHLPATAEPEAVAEAVTAEGAVIVDHLAPLGLMDRIAEELGPWLAALPRARMTSAGGRPGERGRSIARSSSSRELVMHPLALGTTGLVLSHATNFQLHLTQSIAIGPGQAAQPLHRDQWAFDFFPFPNGYEVQCNTIWAQTDFTEENGATRVVVDSNRAEDGVAFEHADTEPAEMEKGSALFYSGSVYHGGGANHTDATRIGVNITYNVAWLRQEENQYLSVPRDVAATLPGGAPQTDGVRPGRVRIGVHRRSARSDRSRAPGSGLRGIRLAAPATAAPRTRKWRLHDARRGVVAAPAEICPAAPRDTTSSSRPIPRSSTPATGFRMSRPLSREEFDDYWIAHCSAVWIARVDGRLAGAYYVKPNFVGGRRISRMPGISSWRRIVAMDWGAAGGAFAARSTPAGIRCHAVQSGLRIQSGPPDVPPAWVFTRSGGFLPRSTGRTRSSIGAVSTRWAHERGLHRIRRRPRVGGLPPSPTQQLFRYCSPRGSGRRIRGAGGRPSCRAIVLRSEGRHFCAGLDFAHNRDQDIAALYRNALRLFAAPLPVVAAVQGSAIGGGLGLALSADFRFATPQSRFSANFSRLGFHHGFGLTVTLPRVVGEQRAADLLYSGRRVDGAEALASACATDSVDETACFPMPSPMPARSPARALGGAIHPCHAAPGSRRAAPSRHGSRMCRAREAAPLVGLRRGDCGERRTPGAPLHQRVGQLPKSGTESGPPSRRTIRPSGASIAATGSLAPRQPARRLAMPERAKQPSRGRRTGPCRTRPPPFGGIRCSAGSGVALVVGGVALGVAARPVRGQRHRPAAVRPGDAEVDRAGNRSGHSRRRICSPSWSRWTRQVRAPRRRWHRTTRRRRAVAGPSRRGACRPRTSRRPACPSSPSTSIQRGPDGDGVPGGQHDHRHVPGHLEGGGGHRRRGGVAGNAVQIESSGSPRPTPTAWRTRPGACATVAWPMPGRWPKRPEDPSGRYAP